MKKIEFSDVEITGGYWRERQEINRKVTLMSVYERFHETHRFDALKCEWKDGDPDMPHIYWDSDVAKWIEGAAYILSSEDDETIAEIIENAIDCIIKNSDENGYAYVALNGADEIAIELDMPVRLIAANRRVHSDAGRVAVMRGPVVYCAEGIDNGADIKSVAIDINAEFEMQDSEFLLPSLKTKAYRQKENESLYFEAGDDYEEIPLTLIPYYAFANRGETEMQIWLLRKQ